MGTQIQRSGLALQWFQCLTCFSWHDRTIAMWPRMVPSATWRKLHAEAELVGDDCPPERYTCYDHVFCSSQELWELRDFVFVYRQWIMHWVKSFTGIFGMTGAAVYLVQDGVLWTKARKSKSQSPVEMNSPPASHIWKTSTKMGRTWCFSVSEKPSRTSF